MADKIKVTMLRALGGYAEGDERELSTADAKRLEARGVVKTVRAKSESAPQNKAAEENTGTAENKSSKRRTKSKAKK